jgi:hypothetical protein
MDRAVRLRLGLLAAAFAVAFGTAPSRVQAGVFELRDLSLFVGGGLFGEPYIASQSWPRNGWRVTGGRLEAQELALQVEIQPPEVGLDIDSGPAVLFAGLTIDGGYAGDMGGSQQVDALGIAQFRACDDVACRFTGEIRIPIDRFDDALDEFMRVGPPSSLWLSVQLTLVRTFGGGTWLQTLEFADRVGIGSVSNVERGAGGLFPSGLFPATMASTLGTALPSKLAGERYSEIVERLRRSADDQSRPIETAPAVLHATLSEACIRSHATLSAHTVLADFVWSADVYRAKIIDDRFPVPVGVPMVLTLHGDDGIFSGYGTHSRPFESTGERLTIDAVVRCSDEPFIRAVDVTTGPPTIPSGGPKPSPTLPGVPTLGPATISPTPPSGTAGLPSPPTIAHSVAATGGAPLVVLAILVIAALGVIARIIGRRGRET